MLYMYERIHYVIKAKTGFVQSLVDDIILHSSNINTALYYRLQRFIQLHHTYIYVYIKCIIYTEIYHLYVGIPIRNMLNNNY